MAVNQEEVLKFASCYLLIYFEASQRNDVFVFTKNKESNLHFDESIHDDSSCHIVGCLLIVDMILHDCHLFMEVAFFDESMVLRLRLEGGVTKEKLDFESVFVWRAE